MSCFLGNTISLRQVWLQGDSAVCPERAHATRARRYHQHVRRMWLHYIEQSRNAPPQEVQTPGLHLELRRMRQGLQASRRTQEPQAERARGRSLSVRAVRSDHRQQGQPTDAHQADPREWGEVLVWGVQLLLQERGDTEEAHECKSYWEGA